MIKLIVAFVFYFSSVISSPVKHSLLKSALSTDKPAESGKSFSAVATFNDLNSDILKNIASHGSDVSSKIRALSKYPHQQIPYELVLRQFQEKYGDEALFEYARRAKENISSLDLDFFLGRIPIERRESLLDRTLDVAMETGSESMINLVISYMDERAIRSGFESACMYGYLEAVKILLNNDIIDPSRGGSQSLYYAIEGDQVEVVKLLLTDDRLTRANSGYPPFPVAGMRGNIDILRVLLKDGRYDPSALDNYAFAKVTRNQNAVRKLLFNSEKVRSSLTRKMIRDARKSALKENDVLFAFKLWVFQVVKK